MKFHEAFIPLLFFGLFFGSCSEESDDLLHKTERSGDEGPTTDFASQSNGDCSTTVLEIVFQNLSSSANSYLWDFGDGTTSTLVNPKKIYAKAGKYKVSLTAFFSRGEMKVEKDLAVLRNSDGKGPVGELTITRADTTRREYDFQISTDALSYSLSFGDGSLISDADTSEIDHIYTGVGRYGVLLISKNSEGASCVTRTIESR